jgi:hypothetical protein
MTEDASARPWRQRLVFLILKSCESEFRLNW